MTTKEILKNIPVKNTPLYNPCAIEEIQHNFTEWVDKSVKQKDKNNWSTIHKSVLGSDIPKEMIYTPLSCKNLDYQMDLGNSGQEPFTRGIHPNMYRGKEFTIRQLTGYGSPENTNERMKFMLDNGATGMNILFDLPTIQMYDSDDPFSQGQVGMSGVCVDTVEDMKLLFNDIPLEKVSISIVTHYPTNTAILFPMFLVLAEERGISWDKLHGSVQNDMSLEELIRSGADFISPTNCFRLQCDNIEFIRKQVPNWNFMTINGYNLREFGTSGITEMAVALSNGISTLDEMIKRGYNVDDIASRMAFFWAPGNDFFDEIARLRAVRRLWYKIIKYRFRAKNNRSMWMRCHVQTSGCSLVQQEPMNNIVRSAYHALAAVLGGVQSLHVNSYDEAYSIPTEEAALISLRTQQIIQEETGVVNVVDPLGGSYYIETLTNEIENRILDEIDEIEKDGGYVEVINNGKLHKHISSYLYDQQKDIENGVIRIVAHNIHKTNSETPDIDVFRYPEGVEEKQKQRLIEVRRSRNNDNVKKALSKLSDVCKTGDNVIPYSIECARARCTEGEIFNVIKNTFGLWHPHMSW